MEQIGNTKENTPAVLVDNKPQELAPRKVKEVLRDRYFGRFEVLETANGWWSDVGKVKDLITCFKNGMTIEQALVNIAITRDQYYYFLELHPEFSDIKQACEVVADMVIVASAHKAARENGKLAFMWLDRRGFFKDKQEPTPSSIIQNNIQINNNGVTERQIEEIVSGAIREAELADRRRSISKVEGTVIDGVASESQS